MTQIEITSKIIEGGNLAIQRLLQQRAKENGFVVVSKNGKVVKIAAKTLLEKQVENTPATD